MPRQATLSIELLETVYTVIRNGGSAAEAEDDLEISQPSMSKRLSHLANAGRVVRHPWIRREGQTWLLTAEGDRVWPIVRRIVENYRQLHRFAGKSDPGRQTLRFACGQLAVETLVKDALRRFTKKTDEVRVWVSTMRAAQRIEGVAMGELDLAQVTDRHDEILRAARRPLHIEDLEVARMALICHPRAACAEQFGDIPDRPLRRVDALAGLPLIVPEADSDVRVVLDGQIDQSKKRDEIRFELEIGGWATIFKYAEARLGVGLVSETALPPKHSLIVRYLDEKVCPPSVSKLICRKVPDTDDELDLTEAGKAWREILLDVAASRKRDAAS